LDGEKIGEREEKNLSRFPELDIPIKKKNN
jgi:hypothetical protein